MKKTNGGGHRVTPETTARLTLTVLEAAKLLGISRNGAYELAARGELPGARRLGRRIIVSRQALTDFLAS
jgi:excisionase family DNA binding protein